MVAAYEAVVSDIGIESNRKSGGEWLGCAASISARKQGDVMVLIERADQNTLPKILFRETHMLDKILIEV